IKALKEWVGLSRQEQLGFKVSKTLENEIERYYFSLYSQRWLPRLRHRWNEDEPNLDAADAMARVPTIMMWDDHDIFDGWGSYSPAMQRCELFQTLFRHARRAFWVFQMQHALADLPPLHAIVRANVLPQDPQYQGIAWSRLLERDRLALPLLDDQPGFTSAYRLGPLALVAADLRTERSRTQILGSQAWTALQGWLHGLKGNRPASA